jgi:cytosine/adenosine deaminase-related metal-dependent hydrolase
MADIVIHDAYVLTVNDRNQLFERGTIVVENGTIRDVRKTREEDATLDADHAIDASGKLAMPGLINAHAHLELTPLIGAVSEFEVSEMLTDMMAVTAGIGRGDYRYLAEAGYELAALNFLNGGITTVNSMDARPANGAAIFGEAGLRGFFGAVISDLFWDIPVDDQFDRTRSFIEEWHNSYDGRITATICPHDDWSCSRELWSQVADFADEYHDLPIHTHLLELDASNTLARSYGADDSLALLEDVGLLDDRLVAAHFRIADDHDVQRIAAADAAVAHCPSVFCYWNPDESAPWTPVPSLREAGATVGIGLDDHYWHDSYNLFGEARQARLAANLTNGANQFSSMALVGMLTIEGAKALGAEDELGSLEPGKKADIVLLDMEKPKFAPLTNLPAQVVNNATNADVETVIVDGSILMQNETVTTMDPAAVMERVTAATERFESETDWDLHIGGSEPPGTLNVAADLPKRGPAHLLGRIGFQLAKDKFNL